MVTEAGSRPNTEAGTSGRPPPWKGLSCSKKVSKKHPDGLNPPRGGFRIVCMFRNAILIALFCTVGLTSARAGIIVGNHSEMQVESVSAAMAAPVEAPEDERVIQGGDFEFAFSHTSPTSQVQSPAVLMNTPCSLEIPSVRLFEDYERSMGEPHVRGLLRPA